MTKPIKPEINCMPLLALWKANPKAIKEMTIEQVVVTAGDGRLRDKNDCSRELREYLSQVQSDSLAHYAEYCLSSAFNRGGMVLQDLVRHCHHTFQAHSELHRTVTFL